MKQISILGCGWLGLPLAKSLAEKGFSVKGSTTSIGKIPLLKENGIIPFQITLSENKTEGEIDAFLENSEILIIDIPPKGNSPENFISKIENLISAIEKSSVKKVIFVGSTSVYADNNSIIDEKTNHYSDSENARQLLKAEHLLQHNKNFQATVVRFGGLIGEGRNPIFFLAGKPIENPDAPINFIHQKDCIGILKSIIEKGCWNEIFNAVAPQHPSRKEYYTKKASGFNMPLPEFVQNKPSNGKKILSEKVEKVLEYEFQAIID